MHDAGLRASYREAADWLEQWGLKVSKSQLQRLDSTQQAMDSQILTLKSSQGLAGREEERGRRWCIEVDGCLVATRVETEVKTAVLYPMDRGALWGSGGTSWRCIMPAPTSKP